MRMLAYIRRSKESDERTVSIDAQRAEIEAYNLRRGFATEAVLVDDGVSGKDRERIIRIKDAIRSNGLRGMVAYHLDRIARDAAAQLDLLAWFKKKKFEMHTCNQGLISIEQSHEFLSIGVQAMLAEYVRKRAVERSLGICQHKRKEKKRYSRFAPYGFSFAIDSTIVANPDETPTYLLIVAGTHANKSATVLMHELNNQRRFNRIGTSWSAGSLARIQERITSNE